MSRLLHIDTSPMGEESVSREVAAIYRAEWEKAAPQGEVIYHDLGAEPIDHLTTDAIMTYFMPPQARSPQQQQAADFRDGLAQELLSADAVLLSAPMHNWTIPSHLKTWIDNVLIVGQTLVEEDEPSPLEGRSATLVLSYGGGYTEEAPLADWNFVEPYLRTVFERALRMDVTVITAELTLCFDDELAELAQTSRRRADELAARSGREAALAAAA